MRFDFIISYQSNLISKVTRDRKFLRASSNLRQMVLKVQEVSRVSCELICGK